MFDIDLKDEIEKKSNKNVFVFGFFSRSVIAEFDNARPIFTQYIFIAIRLSELYIRIERSTSGVIVHISNGWYVGDGWLK